MGNILDIVLPVFGLIGIGYGIGVVRLLPENTDQSLADFVFTIAIPLLIFRTVATADFSGGSAPELWAAYYIGFTITWIAGSLVIRRLFGRDARAGLVAGVSAAYSNALLVGIPLIIAAYGEEGAAAISLLIAVHLPILMTVSAILIERAQVIDGVAESAAHVGVVARGIARNLALNPIVIGLFAGILWRLTGLPISGPGGAVINRLADVAATLALFSVGMNLRKYGVSGHVAPALALAFLKLVLMPAIVLVVVRHVIVLPTVWANAMVIAAACPTGVNAWLVASRFKTGQALASNSITLTTGLAVVTTSLWLHVLEWV
jgi:predicted permease